MRRSSRVKRATRRMGESQDFLNRPDVRDAAGLPLPVVSEEVDEEPPGLLPLQADEEDDSDEEFEVVFDRLAVVEEENEAGEPPGILPEGEDNLEVEDLDVDAEEEFWRNGEDAGGEVQEVIENDGLPSLEEIHEARIPTHKWPPKSARADFTRECGDLWGKCADHPEDVQMWKKLFMFPRVIIPATVQRGSASLGQAVKERLRRWRAGEAKALWDEVLATIANSGKEKRGKKRPASEVLSDEELLSQRNVKRARTIVSEGQFSKAIQALTSAGMAEKSRSTVRELRAKHPPPSEPMGQLPTTNTDPLSLYSLNVFKAALKFKKGTAPGPSGLRPEHLRVILQSPTTRRESASTNLTRLLNKMVAGKVPPEVAPYLCGARLHAAKKKKGGIRPIAVGNLLRRLASKCVASAVADKARAHLSPHQLGVGVQNGCEAIVHATRETLETDGTKFVLQADFKNAFNTASRRIALQEIATHFPEILAWCITCYGNSSLLLFSDAQILSSSGFQQGDPLAALLFALVLHPVVLSINEEVPSLNLNVWYLDDGTLVGDPEQLLQAVEILEREGPARGLTLSTRTTAPSDPKTTVWSPLTSCPDEDPLILNKGVLKVDTPGIILLGAPIGSHAFVASALQSKLEKITQITSLLPTLQDPHAEFCLLRSCLSTPKIMFNLRTVNTLDHPNFLAEFDQLTREALARTLGAPIPDMQWSQSKLPVGMGGLGLRAAEDHAGAAYASSLLSARPLVQQLLGNSEEEAPRPLPGALLDSLSVKVGD